jgi:hypothetical protein
MIDICQHARAGHLYAATDAPDVPQYVYMTVSKEFYRGSART